ncbi:AEC family transporter [Pediococcus ethanolidurans]|uniref:AEC family transporter n=1 Tax=Pediococcus ethanolidurans TaxID=319653 RepID=UPI001C1EDBC3|nr:AEC family transporter [Pediococcus ethanolidurans]MBU7563797.1 AEC family transporter [Pediococcus ethanolidurans]MCT4397418.1 AEC family transporter [Pediococcus ethanolidurans]MCV3316211.1 AEC family transporter [Pediococcus ethanolidurans]MCV3321068.1 AEC family transporter [Pediococcus ethanolidurans]MCV3324646.1 AEC family transporter [Pediococcus ethanolidurans]
MTSIGTIFSQTAIMFLLMMVGYICYRVKILDRRGSKQISDLVIYVANPALLVNSFAGHFPTSQLHYAGYTLVLLGVIYIVTILGAYFMFPHHQELNQFAMVFANVGFIGIPLAKQVLGNASVFYMSLFVGVTNFIIWTYGLYLISQDKQNIAIKKLIVNPAIIALFLGLFLALTHIQLSHIIGTTISDLSNMNLPLVMVALGCYLAEGDVKRALRSIDLYKATLSRLVIAPLLTLLILMFVPNQLLVLKMTLLLGQATPVGVLMAVFSKTYGKDYLYSTAVVGISTLFSLVTIPCMIWVAQLVW